MYPRHVPDLVPWPIRHPSLALLVLLVILVTVFAFVWAILLRHRLRRRAASELRFLDEPSLHNAKAKDEAIAVVRGRLVGVRDGKPVAIGTVVLDAKGMQPVSSDCALSLERSQGRILLLGPFSVLVGSQEGFPVGFGRRVLHAGDEVVISGRWAVEQTGTTNYRDVATLESILPSLDNLELAYAGTPKALGLAEMTLVRALSWGAFFWALALTAGAVGVLEGARSMASERDKIRLASFAYLSPFLQSKVRSFLLDQAPRMLVRDSELSAQWAAIESHFDENHECVGALDNLRNSGKLEDEAGLGVQCGGLASKRRAAEAWMHLGEFAKAAEVLRDAPPSKESVRWGPDKRLDLRVALVTGDFMGAAKLLRTYGHPSFSPIVQSCVAMALEARGGSFLAKEQLASSVEKHWSCALLQADLLDGEKRLALLRNLPTRIRSERTREFFVALQLEADPTGFRDLPEEEPVMRTKGTSVPFQFVRNTDTHSIPAYEERPTLDGPMNTRNGGYLRAVTASALERLDKREDRAALWFYAATWRIELSGFFANVGDESKCLPFLDEAIRLIPYAQENLPYVKRLRAALALRLGAPDAKKSIDELGRGSRLPSSDFLRAALDVHQGEGFSRGAYYADYMGAIELDDATRRGDGEAVLRLTVPQRLIRHLIVAGALIRTGRETLIDKMRYYDPECQEIPCPLEYLADQAATRALVLRHLRAAEIGRGGDQQALEERARKLREPLLRRDIAMPMFLMDQPYSVDWW